MNVVTFNKKPDPVASEAEIVTGLKEVLYRYSGGITVAQAIGCLRIAEGEILEEAKYHD